MALPSPAFCLRRFRPEHAHAGSQKWYHGAEARANPVEIGERGQMWSTRRSLAQRGDQRRTSISSPVWLGLES